MPVFSLANLLLSGTEKGKHQDGAVETHLFTSNLNSKTCCINCNFIFSERDYYAHKFLCKAVCQTKKVTTINSHKVSNSSPLLALTRQLLHFWTAPVESTDETDDKVNIIKHVENMRQCLTEKEVTVLFGTADQRSVFAQQCLKQCSFCKLYITSECSIDSHLFLCNIFGNKCRNVAIDFVNYTANTMLEYTPYGHYLQKKMQQNQVQADFVSSAEENKLWRLFNEKLETNGKTQNKKKLLLILIKPYCCCFCLIVKKLRRSQ